MNGEGQRGREQGAVSPRWQPSGAQSLPVPPQAYEMEVFGARPALPGGSSPPSLGTSSVPCTYFSHCCCYSRGGSSRVLYIHKYIYIYTYVHLL